ncbi:HdeD family acid-resistance protein [Mycobacterium malmoense]|uniref:HdeD family acid-resistance protein n=1 Tax=Mycobacterium malmoense TaxID=1780 RepID=UPI003F75655A
MIVVDVEPGQRSARQRERAALAETRRRAVLFTQRSLYTMPNCVAADILLMSILANDVQMTNSDQTVFEGPLRQLARSAWQLLLLTGVLAVALGVIVLVWPGKTLVVAGVVFGIYLVVSGIGYVFAAFGTHAGAAMRVLTFVGGVVSVVLGLFCFRNELESIMLLALWIGIGWLFRGITLLAAALSFDHLPARGWQALSGVIIVIGGVVLIVSPLDSIAILALVAGWWLIVIGIIDVITAFQVRGRAKA